MYRELNFSSDAIVDEEFLEKELGLSKSFINKYSRRMGVIKRNPRLYFLKNVLEFLEERARQSRRKVLMEQAQAQARKYEINKMFEEIKAKYTIKEGKHEKRTGKTSG